MLIIGGTQVDSGITEFLTWTVGQCWALMAILSAKSPWRVPISKVAMHRYITMTADS